VATDAWGIDDGWHDTKGGWHPTGAATSDALRTAMGGDARHDHPPPGRDVWVLRPGEAATLPRPRRVRLEDGTELGELGRLPGDLPLGIHEVLDDDDLGVTLLVSPGRCHLPEGLRAWGVAMQVPTTRSSTSWGIGDLGDVDAVAAWLARHGGRALGLSPLHAPTPVTPIPPSPYSPSSRRWRNPLLIDVDAVDGTGAHGELAELGTRARALLDAPLVDRDLAWTYRSAALELLWASRSDRERDEVAAYRRRHGRSLELWVTFCALAERHGPDWTVWPGELRHPDVEDVAIAAAASADRLAFHAWLQLLIDRQLERAADHGVRLVQDLAVGIDGHGADGWILQDLLALDVSVGAPPDDFAPDGQRWALPPFIPWRLRGAGYRPLAELLRAGMQPGRGLRVDHVMGLFRLFWIPDGAEPCDGTYVRFAGRELLEVVAMESARAEALVIGEDLGTVEDHARAQLADAGVLSTRLVWFEDEPPEAYPPQSLGMVTTHDLPTVAGLWTGEDEAEQEAVGRPSPPVETQRVRERLARLTGLDPELRSPDDVPPALALVHRRLAAGSSAVVLATLEDATGSVPRPNIPGTTTERANWSVALPVKVDELDESPIVAAVIEPLQEARGQHPSGD
jgi:4-alpha-glucanotransferase